MRTHTLANRLRLLVALVAVVPLLIVGSFALFWLVPQTQEELKNDHQRIAGSVAFQVSEYLKAAARNLPLLAEFLQSQVDTSSMIFNSILDSHVAEGDFFSAIYITDANDVIGAMGLPKSKRQRRPDLLGLDLSRRSFVKIPRNTREPYWSDSFLSNVSDEMAVAHAIPMGNELLVGEIAIDRLTKYVGSLRAQSGLAIVIIDERDQVIVSSRREFAGQKLRLQEPGGREWGVLSRFALHGFELAGREYVATMVDVPWLRWRVLVAQTLSQALRPLRNILWVLGIGMASALVIAVAAGGLLVRGLAGDFSKLADQARAIGEGKYDQPWPDSSIREFADLEAGLMKMSTSIRQREEALADSEARLLKAQSVAHVGSWEHYLKEQVIWGSQEAFRIYGLPLNPSQIMDFESVINIPLEEERPRLIKALDDLINEGTAYDLVFRIRRNSDGELRYVHSMAEVVLGPDGAPAKVIGTVQDLTEIKQAEKELEASRQLLLESQAVAQLGHYSFEVASGTWESSEILDGILGIGRDYTKDMEGWLSLISPEDREEMDSFLRQESIQDAAAFDREYRIIRADDHTERWVHGLGNMEPDDEGHPVKMIGTIQDITERKQLEQQFLQSQKMEAIGLLAGGVAHDFNNMLGVILGYTELLRMGRSVDKTQDKKLAEIEKAALHSRDITRQLLAFSRKQIIAPSPQNLDNLINGTLKTLGRLIGEDVELAYHPAEDAWMVKVDPAQMDQVLVNLAVNARDAMSEGGKLLIELSNIVLDETFCQHHAEAEPGNYVMLAMSDTGHGMDQATIARIYEPFFTTKGVGKGTGLGLATIYGIVKQNGGFINVYSEPGRGTTFKLYLPRHLGGEEPVKLSAPVLPEPGSGAILLVEDEDMVRQVAASMLEELGYEVVSFSSPLKALAHLKSADCDYDLLLTDVVMPEMSGKELRDAIIDLLPNIGVLFMSGYTSNVIVNHGVLEKGVNFIAKPFNVTDLAQKVREAMA